MLSARTPSGQRRVLPLPGEHLRMNRFSLMHNRRAHPVQIIVAENAGTHV